MTQTPEIAAPVAQKDRITILDSLRGFAILGILLMNMPGFALPPPVQNDPSVLNEWGTIDFDTWYFIQWFPEGTQRAIFSMLFGAGILLFLRNKQRNLDGMMPADYFFRRQLWLIVFALVDVFILLWSGDILLDYACFGMIMFAFRNLSPKKLLMGAGFCFLFMLVRENRILYMDKETLYRGEKIAAIDTSKSPLSFVQKEQLAAMQDLKDADLPASKWNKMQKNIEKHHSGYVVLYEYRTSRYIDNLVRYLFFEPWDVLLFMFIGMAFFKMGILTGQAALKTYWLMCIIGLGAGLMLTWIRLQPLIDVKFNRVDYLKSVALSYYEVTRMLRSLGIFGLIMLLYRSGWFKWLFALMRPVGQMAFTNYLMQSLICGIIFYGIGFGQYGKLHRHEIYYVLAAVWIVQIIYSHVWLRFFRFGPMEWAWRSLTYWKWQPIKKQADPPH